jgi:hypothetical protein
MQWLPAKLPIGVVRHSRTFHPLLITKMPGLQDCLPRCCGTPAPINIVGSAGLPGTAGPNNITVSTTTNLTGILIGSGTHVGASVVAISSPANPTGTASTTPVMMGLGLSITPATTGRLLVMITGMMSNGTIADGASAQLRYGTGAAPNNAAAATGTAFGKVKNMVASTASGIQGFSLCQIVSGLTVTTAYWIDVGLNAVTGGTASIFDLDIVAVEI